MVRTAGICRQEHHASGHKSEAPRKEIFTAEQMEKMISSGTGEELVYLALGGYAGLRSAEIEGKAR